MSEKQKSVRFASNVANAAASAPSSARRRPRADPRSDDDYDDNPALAGRRMKRPRLERPNEDEADDVDDWAEQDDEEAAQDESSGLLPKARELLDLKRKRRDRQHHGEDMDDVDDQDESTHIDAKTSLFAESKGTEATIEPFNMDAEQNDGTGYFEGDTFVFRKRGAEEEPDAWLESLGDNKEIAESISERMDEEGEDSVGMDDLSKQELYAKIVPLLGDSESVLQAVARYGGLLKRQRTTTNDKATYAVKDGSSAQAAQKALNDVTEAANALMLKGDVDIYQQTKQDLAKLLPETKLQSTKQGKEKEVVSWEYRGNQDGQLHGPYTTAQMLSWTQAGYFVGTQAVQIRTIRKQDQSNIDDLLSDLMDDQDDEPMEVKGEWQSSGEVDFTLFS